VGGGLGVSSLEIFVFGAVTIKRAPIQFQGRRYEGGNGVVRSTKNTVLLLNRFIGCLN
jgi:hypothetical protein